MKNHCINFLWERAPTYRRRNVHYLSKFSFPKLVYLWTSPSLKMHTKTYAKSFRLSAYVFCVCSFENKTTILQTSTILK